MPKLQRLFPFLSWPRPDATLLRGEMPAGLTVGLIPQAQLVTRERAYSQAWARIIRASGFQPQ